MDTEDGKNGMPESVIFHWLRNGLKKSCEDDD
jgi:hypothetical protein